MNSMWRINLLGGISAAREGRQLRRFQSSKASMLLATLAYDLNRDHTRDELLESIWPESDVLSGRRCLSQALYSLRLQLEPPGTPQGSILFANHTHVRLNPAAVTTDVAEFLASIQAGEEASTQPARVKSLERAMGLYQGELMPGYYEEWVLVERERLAALLARSLRQAVRAFEEAGDQDMALEYALRAVAAAPLREEVHYDVIRLQIAMGQHDEALQRYHRLWRMLRREEGRKPSAATQALIAPLKPFGGFAWEAVGRASRRRQQAAYQRHAEQDRTEAQPITAATADRASLTSAPLGPRLPLTLTQFFGRETEVARLCDMLEPPGEGAEQRTTDVRKSRLVTLLGPGGSGKTRLAVEAARRLVEVYDSAVFYVPLGDVVSSSGIADATLEALGVERSTTIGPMDQIVKTLAHRKALLVFDNAEHLIAAAADFIWTLLGRALGLSCLVTSRQPLGLDGEQEFVVQPLAVPTKPGTPDRLMEFACVQLFVDRAQAVCPDFQITPRNAPAVAAVCQRLEGIPLAIELAAARSHGLTPAQMLTQLSDRFGFLISRRRTPGESRHRTLREAIEWSYQLLPVELQRLFAQLSVFRGGWTVEAAEIVCQEPNAQEFVEQLVERSLVTTELDGEERRFRMLETIREYATEQLSPEDRAAASERHAQYFCRVAESAALQLRGRDMQSWLERLDAERENMRVALEWSVESETGLRTAGALSRFWLVRGYLDEGRRWLHDTLALCKNGSPDARAKALLGAGALAYDQGDFDTARRCFEESQSLSAASGDSRGVAEAYSNLGILYCSLGEPERARCLHEESVTIWRMLDDQWGVAGELNNLGRAAQYLGDYRTAFMCYRESRHIYELSGDWVHAAIALANLGVGLFDQGDLEEARNVYEQSLHLFRQLGNRPWIATLLNNLGELQIVDGDLAAARRNLSESLRLRSELRDRSGIVSTLTILGSLARSEGEIERATRLFGAAESLQLTLGVVPRSGVREMYERDISALRLRLGNAEFIEAWSYGRSLSLDQAIAYALEEPLADTADTLSVAG